ncbi:MAG TPA: CNNM domain-containing protein, partial [Jiangellaceae bacterium]|nr:CNNM domain-containing protein [Jiangellaceae bacterium]
MSGDAWMLVGAGILVVVAGVLAMADAALTSFSKARADALVAAGRRGARRVRRLVEDPAPALNTALLLRLGAEITAVVLVAAVCLGGFTSE